MFWGRFKKNRRALVSLYLIAGLGAIGLFADFLANEKPLACGYQGKTYYPVLKDFVVSWGLSKWPPELVNADWQTLSYDWAFRAPIPFSPRTQDPAPGASYVPPRAKPGQFRHLLGTDNLGRDVAAGMIHGTRIALTVGLVSMLIAFLVGSMIGSIGGFMGDDTLRATRANLLAMLVFFVPAYFYGFMVWGHLLGKAFVGSVFLFVPLILGCLGIFLGILWLGTQTLGRLFKTIPYLKKSVLLPLDILTNRLIEITVSVPTLLLIMAVAAVAQPSLYGVMVIIGLTSWTGIARFTRAEMLRIRRMEYMVAAKSLGFSAFRQMLRHALPNALAPVLVAVAFGVASSVLVEAFLSFLNVGVPDKIVTWGKLLAGSRGAPTAWWLAVFPGLAIFLTVTLFNLIGEGLTDALDPKG